MNPKVLCLIVLSCNEISDVSKKELEETVGSIRKLKNWDIEKVTLMQDQRSIS